MNRPGALLTASGMIVTVSPTCCSSSKRARRMCQSVVISRTEVNLLRASHAAVSSALVRVLTASLPRSMQHVNSLRGAFCTTASSFSLTSGKTPETSIRFARFACNWIRPRSIRPFAPVSTTIASVRCSPAGPGRLTTNHARPSSQTRTINAMIRRIITLFAAHAAQ